MDLRKIIYSECHSPVKVKHFDSYLQTWVYSDMPCGKCYHCRMTSINEWCTRMYAESKYNKNTYYITLDYAPFDVSDPVGERLAIETNAIWSNDNKNGNYGYQPLFLVKSHFQEFHKRLRKNTGIKYQYFMCGEYGSKYGRPHAHMILWSDSVITKDDIQAAWCVDGYKIGNVDFHDLVKNGSFIENRDSDNKFSSKYCFNYVCKYLQKGTFDVSKVHTFPAMYAKFRDMCYSYNDVPADELAFLHYYQCSEKEVSEKFSEFVGKISPFVTCSKRPAIGFKYFEKNAERFEERDFRLFGLSKKCSVFPRYFLRKTKENLCRFDCYSKVSEKSSSSAGFPSLVARLDKILSDNYSVETWTDDFAPIWTKESGKIILSTGDVVHGSIPVSDMHFYDRKDKIFYQFNGLVYNLWSKIRGLGIVKVGSLSLSNVAELVRPDSKRLLEEFIFPLHYKKVLIDKEKNDTIIKNYISKVKPDSVYPDWDALELYAADKKKELSKLISSVNTKQIKYNHTKIIF